MWFEILPKHSNSTFHFAALLVYRYKTLEFAGEFIHSFILLPLESQTKIIPKSSSWWIKILWNSVKSTPYIWKPNDDDFMYLLLSIFYVKSPWYAASKSPKSPKFAGSYLSTTTTDCQDLKTSICRQDSFPPIALWHSVAQWENLQFLIWILNFKSKWWERKKRMWTLILRSYPLQGNIQWKTYQSQLNLNTWRS